MRKLQPLLHVDCHQDTTYLLSWKYIKDIDLEGYPYRWGNAELDRTTQRKALLKKANNLKLVTGVSDWVYQFWSSLKLGDKAEDGESAYEESELLEYILVGMKVTKAAIEFGFMKREATDEIMLWITQVF